MEDLLTTIVTAIVSNPEAVAIDSETVDTSITFTITADKEDIGKIIGKNGKTINAIRSIVKILAMQENKWVSIEVQEA